MFLLKESSNITWVRWGEMSDDEKASAVSMYIFCGFNFVSVTPGGILNINDGKKIYFQEIKRKER